MLQFRIPGTLPNLNDIIQLSKTHWTKYRAAKESVEQYICLCAREQNGRLPSFSRIDLACTWFEANKKRDPDNIVAAKKFILDSLVGLKVIPNDGWDNVNSFHDDWFVSKKPLIWVRVTDALKKF